MMTNVPNIYNSMVASTNLPAPVMTSNLKTMGDGSMRHGLENLVYMANKQGELIGIKNGIRIGGVRGFIAGSLVTSVIIIGSYYLYEKYLAKETLIDCDDQIEESGTEIVRIIAEMEEDYGKNVCSFCS